MTVPGFRSRIPSTRTPTLPLGLLVTLSGDRPRLDASPPSAAQPVVDYELPPVLDPALAHNGYTIMGDDSATLIDPRTGRAWHFASKRAARQQAVALGVGVYRVTGR